MIGERLAELRKDANLTQEELGEILGLTNFTISGYELNKNEPPDETKIRIARYFDVTIDYLLGLTDYPKHYYLSGNMIRLPERFPNEAKRDLAQYLDYLDYKYIKTKDIKL